MFQLKKVAVATLSASFATTTTTTNSSRNYLLNNNETKHKRSREILFLLVPFKAKYRVRISTNNRNQTPEGHTPSDKKKTGFKHLDTFHRAVKTIIFFSQFFGLLPVNNVRADNPKALNFRMQSWPMLFTAIFFIFGGLKTLRFTVRLVETGIKAKNFVSIVFHYTNIATCICFLSLAKSWPDLLQHWTRVDLIFLVSKVYKPISHWTLRFKLQSFAIFFGLIAFVEHCMYYASSYYNFRMYSIYCQKNNTEPATFRDFLVKYEFRDVFTYFPYNILLTAYAMFLQGSFTFIWNFLDVFIMITSLSIARRFEQLAKRMRNNEKRLIPDDIWYEIRSHHIQLIELVARIDGSLSGLVLISCLNNMYFICNQLLNIFTKLRWPINYAYFWFSLAFLIGRTAMVFFCAGQINDASLLPLHSLYMVPSSRYSQKVQRFFAQIKDESVALTGKRFFNVTHKSLFGFIATIVTYELMLLQFDKKNWKSGLPPLCP